jgi:hypothetical protein
MSGWWPAFHEPGLRLSLREQMALHWRANLLMLRSPRSVARFACISLLPVPIMALAAALAMRATVAWVGPGAARDVFLAPAALFLAYLVLQHLAFREAMRLDYTPYVRRALAARGTPVCMRCGHLLPPPRAAASGRVPCPECGAPDALGMPGLR